MIESVYKAKYNRGLKYLKGANITLAKVEFEGVLKIHGNSENAINLLGLCLYRRGDFKRAKALWEKSILINDSKGNRAHEYLNELDREDFRKFVSLYNEGLDYFNKREYEKCTSCLLKSPVPEMEITTAFNILGLCSYALGRRGDAAEYWMKSLELDRGNEEAINYLANCERAKSKSLSIMELIKRLLKKYKG